MVPLLPLALLLAVGLAQDDQNRLMCHVCEQENGFGCQAAENCTASENYCATVASKIFPRFYMVSKQCSNLCPVIEVPAPIPPQPKPYLLQGPMPFIYIKCCKESLCNGGGPPVLETTFRELPGRAGPRARGHAGLTVLTAAALASAGLL